MQINKERITRAFCEKKLSNDEPLLFFPKSGGEARAIQVHLASIGYDWPSFEEPTEELNAQCVLGGMILDVDEVIYMEPQDENLEKGILCDVSQFAENYSPPVTLEDFNKLSAHIGKLQGELTEVKNAVRPKVLSKVRFPTVKK